MLITFTRPIALCSRSLGLMHAAAAYATQIEPQRVGVSEGCVKLTLSVIVRCDGAYRDVKAEPLTVFVQPHDIMAAQDTRFDVGGQ